VRTLTAAGIDPARIALVTQRDSAGEVAYAAGVRALAALGVKAHHVRHHRAERQSTGIERHVDELARDRLPPQACVLAADASVATAFLLAARAAGLRAIVLCTSRVPAEALTDPPPHLVVLQAVDPEPRAGASGDAARREGWYAARILATALLSCSTDPDRAMVHEAVRSLLADGPVRVPELRAFRDASGAPGLWPLVPQNGSLRLLEPGEMAGWGVR
jgi:hypothetical protein